MPYTLCKSERLYLNSEIETLFRSRSSFIAYPFRVIYSTVPPQEIGVKILISVPKKKLKRAVDRNRVKRLTREAYRLHKAPLLSLLKEREQTLFVGFLYLDSKLPSYPCVEGSVRKALETLYNLFTPSPSKENRHV